MSVPLPNPPTLPPPTEAHGYYTIAEAAAHLGVSRITIWRLIRDGRLPVWRLGRRTTRITAADLQMLLQQRDTGQLRAPRADWQDAGPTEHFVQFYEADTVLLDAVAGFIGMALRAGDVGIVVASAAHRTGVEERLTAAGIDGAAARAAGRYIALDAAETLAQFMVGGMPDPDRFAAVIGGAISQAATQGGRVRIFGEMVALLWQAGNPVAAVRLEALWNDLQQRLPFALFCAYPLAVLGGDAVADLLGEVCTEHARVIPAESYTALPGAADRLRAIAHLQQQAQSLADALAAERTASAAAESALRDRDQLLTIAAHELKTPVTAVRGQVQLMQRALGRDGQLEADRLRQALVRLDNGTAKLTRLVEELLAVSRLQTGQLTLTRQATDLAALVRQVMAGIQSLSTRHHLRLTAPAALSAWVDPLRLEQVLTNLLDNALRYSPRGAIDVVLAQPTPAVVEFAVQDQGPGIPPDRRDRLFERFFQAHADDHRSGLGLGLYLSRQIVQQHGGEIWAEFPPDGGMRVTLRLPSAEAVHTEYAAQS